MTVRWTRPGLWGLGLGLAVALGLSACRRTQPGPLVFVSNIMDGTVTIVDDRAGTVRAEKLGSLPHNIELSPDGRTVAVSSTGSSSVTFFDAKTGQRQRSMLVAKLPEHPGHAAIPAELRAQVVSCSQCHGLRPVGDLVNQNTFTPDGRSLLAVAFHPDSVRQVGLADGRISEPLPLSTGPFNSQVSNIVFTPDGQQMVVLQRRKGASGKQDPTGFDHDAPPGNKASLISFRSPDGKRLLGQIVVPQNQPYKVAWHPDGTKLYVSYRSTNKVVEVDVVGHKLLRTFVVGEGPTNVIVDPKGEWLYAPSFYDYPADVIKIELKTGKIRDLLAAHPSPTSVAQDPDTGLLYLATSGLNRLLVIDPTKPKGEIVRWHPCGAYSLDVLVVPGSVRAKLEDPKPEARVEGPPPQWMELQPDGTASGPWPAWYQRPTRLPWGDRQGSGAARGDRSATHEDRRGY